MAISKRLRFEILRRDNHTCRYCGAAAPDAILTVDHVVAVSLGGSDDPSNLVAACKDCNIGKSSAAVDARHVDDVTEDAFRWAAAMRAAFDRAVADLEKRDRYLSGFLNAWENWHYGGSAKTVPLPNDWEQSVAKWYGLGLPLEILIDSIGTAMRKRKVDPGDVFRYMAGVVWSTLTELQHQVAAQLAAPSHPEPDVHCIAEECDVHTGNAGPCVLCNREDCAWYCGYMNGSVEGWRNCHDQHSYEIFQHRFLHEVVDLGGIDKVPF